MFNNRETRRSSYAFAGANDYGVTCRERVTGARRMSEVRCRRGIAAKRHKRPNLR